MKKPYSEIISWFEENMPVAESELDFKNPYQLIVAVILSAQCTDKRVNMVTPALFDAYPSAEALAEATPEQIFTYIRSVSYPNSKAQHLAGMARMLVQNYGGQVPDDIDELQKLPGVGRKTANVVSSIVYNKPVIAVDTHVFRISRRLGLSKGTTPLAVEKDLTANIPAEKRPIAHHWLILHGRYVCTAHKPKCTECGLSPFCAEYRKSHGK
ncbi:MAG: endonuclease III [Bacteroidales bacterium]|nr:endonuclease III [Candidatus Equibacterium intestinale]